MVRKRPGLRCMTLAVVQYASKSDEHWWTLGGGEFDRRDWMRKVRRLRVRNCILPNGAEDIPF